MAQIHTLLVGQPRTVSDERGSWRSAIFRVPVAGPVALGPRGLAGDAVADTENHGSPDQAVCCHPLAHYAFWNATYSLPPAKQLAAGAVGENWTLHTVEEGDVCVGDTLSVGDALVQISAPRYPCSKQERKVGLPGFLKRTMESRRTGWYLRVITPGIVQAGDTLRLEVRSRPSLTIARLNEHMHSPFAPRFAHELLEVPELAAGWKRILQLKLDKVID